jgi:hypothetical protein
MKKFFLPVATLVLLSTAHASQKIGVFVLGAQYERDLNASDSIRFGLGLPLAAVTNGGGALALSGDVAFLRHKGSSTNTIQPYYGAALGLATVLGSDQNVAVGGVVLYPNVLGGLNFNVTSTVSLFAEGSVGPQAIFAAVSDGTNRASGTQIGLGYGVRLGMNYTLR